MPDETKPQDNFDRLLNHLKEGSLATALVRAYRGKEATDPRESMKAILRDRLKQMREHLADTKN